MPKKEKIGQIVSNKTDKTVVVEVANYRPHPKYKKITSTTKKYVANDIQNECNEGDTVRIIEARPLSKRKRWSVVEIIEKAT